MKPLIYLILLIVAEPMCIAQSGRRFSIASSVIAGGGTTYSSSARFQLGSTIAQPLAATPSSARFAIQGGFWIWPAPTIFAPVVSGSNVVVSFQTEAGRSYTLSQANSLDTGTWQTITNLAGDGTVKKATVSTSSQGFFKLVVH